MPKICYVASPALLKNPARMAMVDAANTIIEEFQAQGFDLTLRQLYYQFVSKGLLPNKDLEYKRLGGIITEARLAGLVDWEAIVDRTRNLKALQHWKNPQELIAYAAKGYYRDKWRTQPYRLEVWIEKDALAGVFAQICPQYDVAYFSCRGYTSISEMWVAAQRLQGYIAKGQTPVILHFGDHDPSGVDMTRDIRTRLKTLGGEVKVRRIALTMEQVQQYNPPPNPAKMSDGRAKKYIAKYGHSSWELDALSPTVLAGLVRAWVLKYRDEDLWTVAQARETKGRDQLKLVAQKFDDLVGQVPPTP